MTAPFDENRTVLIVDDDTESRQALACLLRTHGYRSYQAENGLQALEQLETAIVPELILLDLDMPVMDGREFLSRLRYVDGQALSTVIVITGQDPRGMPDAAAVLRKPISITELLALMQDLKRHSQPRDRN